jgi:HK97 family phage prohead protease/HK97 family phage major capsid protein
MDNIETRNIELRYDEEDRTVTGIAVPFDQDASIGGVYTERFVRGSISEDVSDVKLFYGHEEPIGKLIEGRDTESGFEIVARISDTARGNEVRTLLKDGVLNKFSVGFVPVESERDGTTVIRKSVSLREVSVVPFPAYAGATIQEVREDENPNELLKEIPMESRTDVEFDVQAVQEDVAELRRLVESGFTVASRVPAADKRSAGEVLKAIIAGDENTIRTYAGNDTSNSVLLDTFIGDLTRIVDTPIGVRALMSTGVLPATGNVLEYAKLESNSVALAEQEDEGDDLEYGQVSLKTETAAVKTFGGYTTLSRQAIERSSVNFLDAHMRAMASAIATNLNNYVRAGFVAQHDAHITAGGANVIDPSKTLANFTYVTWLDALVDAADRFERQGWAINALAVSKTVFKALMALEGADGRPLLVVQGNAGNNTVGQISPLALGGSFAGLTVAVDTTLTGAKAAFVNSNAIRLYTSPTVSLTDDNIINLSRDFSVYQYAALATEAPEAILPVVIDAA